MFAHHSFSAEFDAAKPVSLKGTVTKVDWLNSHIWIYMGCEDCAEFAPSRRKCFQRMIHLAKQACTWPDICDELRRQEM
jgi:hypothetical protein